MIKKTALLFSLIFVSLNTHAHSLNSLNSAMSVMNLNRALVQKVAVIPYAGKDITVSENGTLPMAVWTAKGLIC